MSPQEGDVKGLVVPDLSKAQNANEFLILCFLLNFFQFFLEKSWLMSNIQRRSYEAASKQQLERRYDYQAKGYDFDWLVGQVATLFGRPRYRYATGKVSIKKINIWFVNSISNNQTTNAAIQHPVFRQLKMQHQPETILVTMKESFYTSINCFLMSFVIFCHKQIFIK